MAGRSGCARQSCSSRRNDVIQCIIVIGKADQETFRRRYAPNMAFMNVQIADGGAERFDSVANALQQVKPEADFVAIHDAVRPCLTDALINSVFSKAEQTGAALLAVPVPDTVKRVDGQQQIQETITRQGLWLAQTPQVFRRDWLVDAYARRGQLGKDITDDAQLIEAAGHTVHVVEGAATNIKITCEGRPDPGRGDPEGPAQAQAKRAAASLCRGRDVGRPRQVAGC